MLTIFPDKLRAEIRQANPISSLAVSLGGDDLVARSACESALKVLTGHGEFMRYLLTLKC
jgi:hypothetical protein